MTNNEEKYVIDSIEAIRKTVDENNTMLKEIIKYINYISMNASNENMDDFGRNVLANLISTFGIVK